MGFLKIKNKLKGTGSLNQKAGDKSINGERTFDI